MSQDLENTLNSIQTILESHGSRLASLEARGQDQGQDWGAPATMGWCSPTSPPGPCIKIQRGFAFTNDLYNPSGSSVYPQYMMTTAWPDYTFDLRSHVSAFSDAYYYRFVVVTKSFFTYDYTGWDLFEDSNDWETYQECVEAAWNSIAGAVFDLYDGNPWDPDPIIPFAALILRNNGTTGAAGEIENVTLHDTEQSSFFVRDFRPWFWAAS